MKRLSLLALCAPSLLCACQFYARGPEDYRKVTRALVETRSDQIRSCYEGVLKETPDAEGTVVVKFDVAPETGKIENAKVADGTTAPEPLGKCIVDALDGLTLDPPDKRQGDATFSWTFKKKG